MSSSVKPKAPTNPWPGIWIVATVLIIVAIRLAWAWMHFPHQLNQLARAFSSIDAFQAPPVVNHAGTRVAMVRNTAHGMGIFIANLKTRTEQTICEAKDMDVVGESRVLGWSPDDATFAYRWAIAIHFVNGDRNKVPETIPAPYLASFVWLSPRRCAYIDRSADTGGVTQLAVAQLADGAWRQTSAVPLPTRDGAPHSLVAIGTNAVAWQTDHAVWQMRLPSGTIKLVLRASPKCSIASVSYSQATHAFLYVELTSHARQSRLFSFAGGARTLLATRPLGMRDAQWINNGQGYDYRIQVGENMPLFVRASATEPEQVFFRDGDVASLCCDGSNATVYALAAHGPDAFGIWRCNASTGSPAQQIFSPWGFHPIKVAFQPALVGYAPMPNHHNERFVLIPPAHFSRQGRYPLIIGMQQYDWMDVAHATYSQALADCGAYVALTGYHYTHQSEAALLANTNNVLAVYNQMIRNPNVDPSRVYLFAFSSSTVVVNKLLESYPGRWRGIMLFNPTAQLPEARAGMTSEMLVTAGAGETWLSRQFPEYQQNLARAGIPMSWFIHPDEGHIEYAQSTFYERTLLMGKMVLSH